MNAITLAVEKLGGQSALAAALGLKQQHVWNWLNRDQRVPPEHCAAIETATGGAVRRWDLRPSDWHRIWPELIGAEGAPDTSPTCKAA